MEYKGAIRQRRRTYLPPGVNIDPFACKPDIVIQACENHFNSSFLNGNTHRRDMAIVNARSYAHYFMSMNPTISLKKVSIHTGKDHASVIHSRDKIENFAKLYQQTRDDIFEIAEDIKWLNQIDMEINTIQITNNDIRMMYWLLDQLGIRWMKEDMVQEASDGRTTSVHDLTRGEMDALLNHLRQKVKDARGESQTHKQSYIRMDNMRKRIYSMCYTLGWTRLDPDKKKMVVDQEKLDAWLLKYGYLHKELNDYTYMELPALITQFEKLLKSTLNNL